MSSLSSTLPRSCDNVGAEIQRLSSNGFNRFVLRECACFGEYVPCIVVLEVDLTFSVVFHLGMPPLNFECPQVHPVCG